MGIKLLVFLSVTLFLVEAEPSTVQKICHSETEENSLYTYEEYGTAVLNAAFGDPVDLVIIGSEYLTKCLIEEYPKSQFLRTLDTGLQCAKTAYDTSSFMRHLTKIWKRDVHVMPSSHMGKLNITAVAGEYLLLSLNLTMEIPSYRVEKIKTDPRVLPCDFNEYDKDGNGEITKSEFDEFLEGKGFWSDELLFRILLQGEHGAVRPDTFHRITPTLNEYIKFEKCSQIT